MTTNRTPSALILRKSRGERLAKTSALFEDGELADASTDESFVLRINTAFERSFHASTHKAPVGLADAITKAGKPNKHAELIVFGRWLLVDRKSNILAQRGAKPDLRNLLSCVAAAKLELRREPAREKHGLFRRMRTTKTRSITKTIMAAAWKSLFSEELPASAFDTRLKSMRRVLEDYIAQVRSGAISEGGKVIKSSPELQQVLAAITPGKKERAITQEASSNATPDSRPAVLSPFDIPLQYSTDDKEEEYRGIPSASLPASHLRYTPSAVSSTSAAGVVRSDRRGRIVLTPDIAIRGAYKTKALIDRMVVLVETRDFVSPDRLHRAITQATKATTYVQDLTAKHGIVDWGTALPDPEPSKGPGHHFAILMQDPTPDSVTHILETIRDTKGITGDVTLHLIEIAVDFYPKATDPEDRIFHRERIVGFLQRHHWTPYALFCPDSLNAPRHIDGRQVFAERTKPKYLFSRKQGSASGSDSNIGNAEVRARILTSKPGKPIYLNSTVWKGSKSSGAYVSIQHKIADRRNPEKKTMVMLPEDARRVRIEVTLSGNTSLKQQGLNTVNDLGSVSFRKLAKPFLSFKVGTIEPRQHLLEDAQTQLQSRGVFALELRERARRTEERERMRATRQNLPRNTDREGLGLDDWREMNDVVGRALDELGRRWRAFSWS